MVLEKNKIDLDKKLKTYIDAITNAIEVDQIILFGSYAKGTAHEYSDIDLAVISKEIDFKKPRWENVLEIKQKSNLMFDPDLQIIPYSSDVFFNENTLGRLFIREIKKTGKIIYKS